MKKNVCTFSLCLIVRDTSKGMWGDWDKIEGEGKTSMIEMKVYLF